MAGAPTWLAGWRPYLLLGALCLGLYLPGIAAIPVLDRDEARFAQASRQMLETGDFLRIRFLDEARNNKPAGIYWLQAAAVGALSTPQSTAIWPYRVPSLIGASLAVLFTFGFGRALLRGFPDPGDGTRTALIAAVLLASALGTVAEAHIAKTDATLLAAIVAGQGALGLCYVRARGGAEVRPGIAAAFWLAQIAAIFLKGPVGPALALVTAAILSLADRDARWLRGLRPVAGLIATALAVAPWLYAIEHATRGQFLAGSLGRDFLAKLLGAQESHGAPPLYYLALAMLTFWPGSLYLAPALLRGWRLYQRPAMRFLVAWIAPAWVVLELIPTKLPHYALPLYPALALLAAGAMVEGATGSRRARLIGIAGGGIWVLVTLAIAAALIALPMRFGDGVRIAGIAGAGVLIVLMAALLYRRPGPAGAAALLAAMALALIVPASLVIPGLDRLWLSRAAAALIADHQPQGGTALTVIGYNEPSLAFLLGGRLQTATTGAAATLNDGDEALVNERDAPALGQGLALRGLAAKPLDSVRGTDYSNGQRMALTLYRIEKN
ncbi:MAG TPA: glycosyltransferase family 39 protein [Stellaceae bacterium]|nr:glycosyltransferase family 39 protein [Stellaceae bacterium]